MPTITEMQLPRLALEEPGFAADPWPQVAAAREQHPWLATCAFGYVVHGHQAIRDLLWLDHSFQGAHGDVVEAMDAAGTNWGRFEVEMIINLAGDDHTRIRKVLAPAFTPQQAEKHRALMRQVISELLDEWLPRGAFDFEEFASYFPITVVASLIGAPASALPGLRASLEAFGLCMSMDRAHLPAIVDAVSVLDAFVQDLVARRREALASSDNSDMLGILVLALERGDLTERELYDVLIVLFVAGYDTSKNALTILMNVLLDRPDLYERCAADLGYCRKVVEEGFRFMTTSTIPRMAVKDVTYDGVVIPAGTMVFFSVSLSGRDPDAFPEPHLFDPERPDAKKHQAFGMGAHICLGQFIARAQIQEGLHLIAQRMRNPRRTGPSGWRPFYGVWGLRGLPVQFDAEKTLEPVS